MTGQPGSQKFHKPTANPPTMIPKFHALCVSQEGSSTSTDDNTLVEEILGPPPLLFDTVVANLTFFDETIRVGKTRITASTALIYHFNVTYGD
jgi:hypothetical protein